MDKFAKRLKEDAAAIDATVSDDFERRLAASLAATRVVDPVPVRRSAPATLWWASSLTGLAAAVAVIVVLNWGASGPAVEADTPFARSTVPELVEPLAVPPGLDVRTADFTSPLEVELEKLRSDIEKARETVREDLEFSF
jgi:hypothetical protein